jgi:23S rRNA pseudouridine1911/1915/1917 synthase
LLFALQKESARKLSSLFREGEVEKEYLAWVYPSPPHDSATLIHWYREEKGVPVLLEGKGEKGVEVTLFYRVEERVGGKALLFIKIHPGKKHQIRLQLSKAGFPVLGDSRYGSPYPYHPGRIALHGGTLAFPSPETGKMMKFSCPPPEDFLG